MTTISCERCGTIFGRKQHLIAHLNRINECVPTLSTIECRDILEKISFKTVKSVPCSICNKLFTLKTNALFHETKCRLKNPLRETTTVDNLLVANNQQPTDIIIKQLTEQVQLLQLQFAELKNNQSNSQIINNQTINNPVINNNIIINKPFINPFGQETTDHLNPDDLIEYIKQYRTRFVDILNLIYEFPENKNVRLLSLKNKLIEVYTGDAWTVRNSTEIADAMIQKTNDLGTKTYNASKALQEMDATEENEYRIRKLLTRISVKQNLEYYNIKNRVIADLCCKKRQLLAESKG
jgi:hypothetical protein